MSGAKDWAKEFFEDVRARQINTIVTKGITGRGMDSPQQGLSETVAKYKKFLLEEISLSSANEQRVKSLQPEAYPGAFAILKEIADKPGGERSNEGWRQTILRRISAKSDELQKLENTDLGKLSSRERSAILKAWELGTSQVVMQTTIDLDGDLVMRIDRNYTDARSDHIRQLHEKSVETSLGTWNSLVAGAIQLSSHFKSWFG